MSMFGSKNTKEDSSKSSIIPTSNPNMLNSLVKGTIVEGTVVSESDIRIDGVIKGKLTCKAKVIIGPSGSIEGEVRCANAVIEGKFHGNLFVTEQLSVRETAEVVGDISTGKLIVQSGAIFNVTCKMTDGSSANGYMKNVKETANVVTAAKS